MPSSHALLLRLFLSPSFFSVHVALRYLLLYSDNVGITYYLTRRLRELNVAEIHDIWAFICHLLVSRPSKSRALEAYVVDIAQRSTHIAMATLWFMQASIQDMSMGSRESPSFMICQNVLHKCHEVLFGDLPQPVSSTPYSGLSVHSFLPFPKKKIKHNVEPTLVGIGIMLAGTPGLPLLTEVIGEVAVEQGRANDSGRGFINLETRDDDSAPGVRVHTDPDPIIFPEDTDGSDSSLEGSAILALSIANTNCTDDPPSLSSYRPIFAAAQTVPALPLYLQRIRRSGASEDPLGQRDAEEQELEQSTRSSPSLSLSLSPLRSSRNPVDTPETILSRYDAKSQSQLLRSHYCLSEVQFLFTLENICNRLLVIPKPARVSGLRAELTALNHRLPAEVCMPLWCSSSDTVLDYSGFSRPHHRIVRIPPGESVVLNSAERAPYLLLVEILHDDLGFDPGKRANKEVLRKIVSKELEKKGASRDLVSFSHYMPHQLSPHLPNASPRDSDVVTKSNHINTAPLAPIIIPPTPDSASMFPEQEEEIDLVEQLYGAEKSLHSRPIDLNDSIVLPPAPKNRDLDMVAWARSTSIPSTPQTDSGSVSSWQHRVDRVKSPTMSIPGSPSIVPPHESSRYDQGRSVSALSLDEYSERMRTAAVMLAQLNSNLFRESIIPIEPSSNRQGARERAHNRMKLQHSEATAIKERIMQEMMSLEEERMERMRGSREDVNIMRMSDISGGMKSAEDEGIIRRELNKVDPSAIVFSESWAAKKSRIRHASPYGHLAKWDCISVIVKTGGDLRQEQLAVQLIRQFQSIWEEEKCQCWVRYFRILITGASSGLVETITDAVSIHSIKKAEYAKRFAEGQLGHVTLLDHFKSTYGDPSTVKFARAQRNFAQSLAGYSVVTYLLQVKDRHNGNILLDRDGHVIHIDFGFILSNTPGNIGFEAAPFKLPAEYVEVMGGIQGQSFLEFKRLFHEGFAAARKHCDQIITLVELMEKDSAFPCFMASAGQTSTLLRERFQPTLTHSLMVEYVDRLIDNSLGSHWTRLYDSYQYYSQSIL